MSIVFLFDTNFFFDWGYWSITQNGVLKHQIKVHLCLRISFICPSDTIYIEKSFGKIRSNLESTGTL